LLVVGVVVVVVCWPVSLLLLQAEVWVVDVVVVDVNPAFSLGGFVTEVVVVVVPQSFTLSAWATDENTTAAKVNANPSAFSMLRSYSILDGDHQWPFGVPPPLFVVGVVVVTWPVSLLLLQAEVWVVVVVDVKPAFSLGGFVTAVVVVPQFLTLSACAGENQVPPTAIKVKANPNSSLFSMLLSCSVQRRDRQWPCGVPPPLLVVGPVVVCCVVCRPVSLLLLQAEVWVVVVVVVVVCVKPAFSLGGFVTGCVVVELVVPQFLTLSAWAGENPAPQTAVNTARVVATVRFLNAIGLLLQARAGLHGRSSGKYASRASHPWIEHAGHSIVIIW
jgi:hypothetical protein